MVEFTSGLHHDSDAKPTEWKAATHTTVTRHSCIDRLERTIDIPIDYQTYQDLYRKWQNGGYIQEVFPMLDENQREFLVSGMTPEQWDETFPDE